MNQFWSRIIRAMKLDRSVYEEVEADPEAFGQALGVVLLSSVAMGISGIMLGLTTLFWYTIAALLGWFVWAWVIYLVGTKMFPESRTASDMGELLKVLGFASAPGLIQVFGIIPGVGFIFFPLASLWMLAATVIAVKQALDYSSTMRAVGVCFVGWLLELLVSFGLIFLNNLVV